MATAQSILSLMFGRLIIGIGVGVAAQVVPVYLAEVAPIKIRGSVVAVNAFMITLGQLIAVVLVFLLRPYWRIMLGLAGVPSTIQFVGMLFLPESPRWLAKGGRPYSSVMHRIYKAESLEGAID